MKKRVFIVGAGPAGLAAAEAAAALGAKVTICGAEPVPPYWRPRLTRCLSEPVEAEKLLIRKPDWYAERGIELLTGMTVQRIDVIRKTVVLTERGEASWDALVLAMGASAATPAVTGAEHALTLRTYADAERVRQEALAAGRAAVVGGGLLGLETAWELNAAGVAVTLVERNRWLMPRQLNRAGGETLQRRLESAGIRFLIGRDPSSLAETYAGACVVLCAGVQANLPLLAGTGIALGRAVTVDDRMRTSAGGVWACGDVAEYNGRSWGLLPVAQEQGKVAGANAAGGDAVYRESPPSPMLKVGAHGVFSVGDMSGSEGATTLEENSDNRYVGLTLRESILIGASLVGDTSLGMKLKKAVGEKRVFTGAKAVGDILTQI